MPVKFSTYDVSGKGMILRIAQSNSMSQWNRIAIFIKLQIVAHLGDFYCKNIYEKNY